MGMGSLFTAAGYMIYAFSDVFGRLLSDFSFSLFLAFANTGFLTFYQKNVPVDIMGRVGSFYSLVEAVFIIVVTAVFGAASVSSSVRGIVIAGAAVMLALAAVLCSFLLAAAKGGLLMYFKRINVNKHKETAVSFREDSFFVSFSERRVFRNIT